MSTARSKVEVVGPGGRRWLWLPASAPVADLLPALVRMLGDAGGDPPLEIDEWALAPPVGRPLDPEASLTGSGVRPGSTLCLVRAQLAADADGVLHPLALVGMRTPLERTHAALPTRLTGWARLSAAMELARERPAPPPAAAGGGAVHPASLEEFRPPPPWRRAWQAWRALDYVPRLQAAVTAPRLRRGVTVAVVSPTAGAGKTIVAALLGTLLAQLRRDRVIALDASRGPRSLAAVVGAGRGRFPGDLGTPDLTLTGLDASLGQGYHGLGVLSAPQSPGQAIQRLRKFAGVLVVDCGPGLEAPATRAAVGAADQVLVVTDASPAARAALGRTVDLVRRDDRPALLVANAPRSRAGPHDAGRVAVSAADADGLVALPWSPAGTAQLASGRFDWETAPGAWRRAVHELAVALVVDWARLGLSLPLPSAGPDG